MAARRAACKKETSGESASANSIPILQAIDQFFGAWVLWTHRLRSGQQLIGQKDVGLAVGVSPELSTCLQDANHAGRAVDRRCGRCGRDRPNGRLGKVCNLARPTRALAVAIRPLAGFKAWGSWSKGIIAGPFVVVCLSGDGHFAVSLLSNRHARGQNVADVPVDIGIDRILTWAPDALHDFAKFFPVARLARPL